MSGQGRKTLLRSAPSRHATRAHSTHLLSDDTTFHSSKWHKMGNSHASRLPLLLRSPQWKSAMEVAYRLPEDATKCLPHLLAALARIWVAADDRPTAGC